MSAVRPPVWPQLPAKAAGPAAPGQAGQASARSAFFAAALGQSAPPPKVAAPEAPAARAVTPHVVHVNETAEPPQRILRPGSLLDIRV